MNSASDLFVVNCSSMFARFCVALGSCGLLPMSMSLNFMIFGRPLRVAVIDALGFGLCHSSIRQTPLRITDLLIFYSICFGSSKYLGAGICDIVCTDMVVGVDRFRSYVVVTDQDAYLRELSDSMCVSGVSQHVHNRMCRGASLSSNCRVLACKLCTVIAISVEYGMTGEQVCVISKHSISSPNPTTAHLDERTEGTTSWSSRHREVVRHREDDQA
jgi:hypothetical protein